MRIFFHMSMIWSATSRGTETNFDISFNLLYNTKALSILLVKQGDSVTNNLRLPALAIPAQAHRAFRLFSVRYKHSLPCLSVSRGANKLVRLGSACDCRKKWLVTRILHLTIVFELKLVTNDATVARTSAIGPFGRTSFYIHISRSTNRSAKMVLSKVVGDIVNI